MQAETNYEIRMPAGASAATVVESGPAATTVADGSTNSSTATAVPDLSSNTSSGVAPSSAHVAVTMEAWTSFDRIDGYGASPTTYGWAVPAPEPIKWIAYQFESPIAINRYGFYGHGYAGSAAVPKD